MSGGVDSALAAHEAAGWGPAVAVTLELWADDEHDAEGSCCSASERYAQTSNSCLSAN